MRPKTDPRAWRPRTRLVRAGLRRSQHGETNEAIYVSSGFRYDDPETVARRMAGEEAGFVYSRVGNPTVAMFEDRLAAYENAPVCRATATGMAAVTAALLCHLRAGDKLVAARAMFGSCVWIVQELLPRFGVKTVMVDGSDLEQWAKALPGARTVLFETPANPTMEIVDIAEVCRLAHREGARVAVDNAFASPALQRPMELGADIVVYSATKHIDGQGRCLGGAILSDAAFVEKELGPYLRHTGPAMSPFNAWVMVKGLETLELRMKAHGEGAAKVADALAAMPGVKRVFYPGRADHPQAAVARKQMSGGGNMMAFEIAGDKARAFEFQRRLRLIDISNNLGDAKSLITHPATTTHQSVAVEERARLGITDGLLRLSVGLEDPEDIVDDLRQALGTN
ncbi:MAG: O-succinylhomoserine sulfhydrylase [Alphaproteobacteria bacterium]|nr:O-succinylhomoserine sulfhydrylase [Alphaproteobacteria bacterium]